MPPVVPGTGPRALVPAGSAGRGGPICTSAGLGAPATGTSPALQPVVLGIGLTRPNRSALDSVNQTGSSRGRR